LELSSAAKAETAIASANKSVGGSSLPVVKENRIVTIL
jgi:hypothetical protein